MVTMEIIKIDFRKLANKIYEEGCRKGLILHPSREELRELAKKRARITKYGSLSFISKIRSRSAKFTKSTLDDEFTNEDYETLLKVKEYLKDKKLVCVDRVMGRNEKSRQICRLLIRDPWAYVAYAWGELLDDVDEDMAGAEPDLITISLPDWEERKILVDGPSGVTFALGSDYIGEEKKSFLRMWMFKMKEKGNLGLHAGSKMVIIRDKTTGKLKNIGQLYMGLSATGKSTLTIHGFYLKGEERCILYQDDIGAITFDGSYWGTEGRGMFVKTDGLNPDDQPEIYRAVLSPNAILENVWVTEDGDVDFYDTTLTSNGRAVILRRDVPSASVDIDLPRVDQIFFLTRNPLVPAVAKLPPKMAAAFFVLGESVESSAGDPTRAGQAVRVVGTNPFIVGSKSQEGNMFLDVLKKNPEIECFLLNTGSVGEGERQLEITLSDTIKIILSIVHNEIKWKQDPYWKYLIAEKIEGIEAEKLDPSKLYDEKEYLEKANKLREDRINWLKQFEDGLYLEIIESIVNTGFQ
ncbi:MAG: phosphoenolpyruvate carboxykinase (ATP) [Candidatus Odinarchaeia archaeon]